MEKFLKQAGICIIILLSVLVLQSLNITWVNKGLTVCSQQISKNYTVDDLVTFGTGAIETMKGASAVIASVAISPNAGRYGEPIDEMRVGKVSSIYAVCGGTVIAAGEDEKLGRYIKIAHGNKSESTYGHCSTVYVRPLERVKKGQIIAEYENESEEEFYYAMAELK